MDISYKSWSSTSRSTYIYLAWLWVFLPVLLFSWMLICKDSPCSLNSSLFSQRLGAEILFNSFHRPTLEQNNARFETWQPWVCDSLSYRKHWPMNYKQIYFIQQSEWALLVGVSLYIPMNRHENYLPVKRKVIFLLGNIFFFQTCIHWAS